MYPLKANRPGDVRAHYVPPIPFSAVPFLSHAGSVRHKEAPLLLVASPLPHSPDLFTKPRRYSPGALPSLPIACELSRRFPSLHVPGLEPARPKGCPHTRRQELGWNQLFGLPHDVALYCTVRSVAHFRTVTSSIVCIKLSVLLLVVPDRECHIICRSNSEC